MEAWLLYGMAMLAVVGSAVFAVRSPRAANGANTALLSGAFSLGAGFFLAGFATPDWNPLTMLLAYSPFVLIAVFMFTVAWRVVRSERARS